MERRRGRRAKKTPWQKQRHKDLKERDLAQVETQSSCASLQCWPGAARRLVTFLARPRKVTKRKPPLVSRPLSGVPLCCLPRRGDCGTRPGEAHTTRLTAGLPRFPAGVAWGGIRGVGTCVDMGGPRQGACSRKRSCA